MNRFVTHLIEEAAERNFAFHTRRTPNPFRRPDAMDLNWVDQSPEAFYALPEALPQVTFTPLVEQPEEKLARFSYASPYPSPRPENNTVHGLADLRPEGKARAAMIFLHGHTMTRATIFPLLWYARRVAKEGIDLYYLNLPYHMRRAPQGTWSGQLSLNSDVYGSAMAFRQGVMDVRALISWILAEKNMPVVLAGISLGAYTACMTTVVDDRPSALISILGGANFARIHWDGYQCGKPRRQLIVGGVTFETLDQWWRLMSPGRWQTKLPAEKIMMIAGTFDEIVTSTNVSTLWRAWGQPRIHWYPCGHLSSVLYHRQISGQISSFLSEGLTRRP